MQVAAADRGARLWSAERDWLLSELASCYSALDSVKFIAFLLQLDLSSLPFLFFHGTFPLAIFKLFRLETGLLWSCATSPTVTSSFPSVLEHRRTGISVISSVVSTIR